MNSEIDEIEQQIILLQQQKNKLKITNTQNKLNDYVKKILFKSKIKKHDYISAEASETNNVVNNCFIKVIISQAEYAAVIPDPLFNSNILKNGIAS